jgi:hypothetical protein
MEARFKIFVTIRDFYSQQGLSNHITFRPIRSGASPSDGTINILTYVLVLLVLALRVGVPEAEREGVHVRRLLLVHGPRVNRLQQEWWKISGHFPIIILQNNCAYLLEGKWFVTYKNKQRFRTRLNKSGSKQCSIRLWINFLSGSGPNTMPNIQQRNSKTCNCKAFVRNCVT